MEKDIKYKKFKKYKCFDFVAYRTWLIIASLALISMKYSWT